MENTVLMGGSRPGRTLESRVRLWGDKATDQVSLIEKAIQVAASKVYVGTLNPNVFGNAMPQSLALNIDMYENKVECRARVWATPGGTTSVSNVSENFWGSSSELLAFTPFSEPGDQPKYKNRGTAGILLQAAAYYDPCIRQTILIGGTGQLSTLTTGGLPGTGGQNSIGTVGPGSPENPGTSTMTNIPQATLTTRPLTPGGQQSKLTTTKLNPGDGSIWTDFEVRMYYEKDRHVYMMGITSPNGFQGNNVAFCQLAAPTMLLIADWTASKYGLPPDIPHPASLDPNLVLMDDHYELPNIQLAGNADVPLYRISGTYTYGFKRTQEPTINDLLFPQAPWFNDGAFNRRIPAGVLTHKIID